MRARVCGRYVRTLPWLRVLFPREGYQRSFESVDKALGQHHALTSLQPQSDILGHRHKAMGRLMVPMHEGCAPLRLGPSGAPTLTPAAEEALAVEMCWTLHRTYGAQAYRACASAAGGRVHVLYRRIGFDGRTGRQVLFTHVFNFSVGEARAIFAASHSRWARGEGGRHGARLRGSTSVRS